LQSCSSSQLDEFILKRKLIAFDGAQNFFLVTLIQQQEKQQ